MDDLISRQQAIDHWRLIIDATNTDSRYNMGFVDGLEFCISHLSTMPSAQPEISCSEIPNNSDAISRQAAIDAFNTNIDELVVAGKENADAVERYLNRVIDEIKQLPPIQPAEPKRGKWIEIEAFDDSRYVKCDQCKTVQVFYYGKRNTNFCPNCGADMRGEQK